ncbi:hypothetical protein HK405_002786 [Cladochytrium tenue]|nr:hypothetical protein HK405_002786 [Cladochytrium tenue]
MPTTSAGSPPSVLAPAPAVAAVEAGAAAAGPSAPDERDGLAHVFDCESCGELLFEPVTLPCGASVCRACLRLPDLLAPAKAAATAIAAAMRSPLVGNQHQQQPLPPDGDAPNRDVVVASCLLAYVCPSRRCRARHLWRNDRVNCTLAAIVDRLFPTHVDALRRMRTAQVVYSATRRQSPSPPPPQPAPPASSNDLNETPDSDLSLSQPVTAAPSVIEQISSPDLYGTATSPSAFVAATRSIVSSETVTDISASIEHTAPSTDPSTAPEAVVALALAELNEAIALAPDLQAPLLLRAKILTSLGRWRDASCDALAAAALNPANRRGAVAMRLISLRRRRRRVAPSFGASDGEDDDNSGGVAAPAPGIMPARPHARSQSPSAAGHRLPDALPTPTPTPSTKAWRGLTHAALSLVAGDLECNLCLGPLRDPVTSPCGHAWCRGCALRALDHDRAARRCPLCRTAVPGGFGYVMRRPATRALQTLCEEAARLAGGAAADPGCSPGTPALLSPEEPQFDPLAPIEIPVFVCSLVMPESTQSFHIFEPRYRVMVEESLRGTRRFGICLPARSFFTGPSFVEFGTMLEITHAEALDHDKAVTSLGLLPRYVVSTVALHRFRVLSHRQTREGLDYATVVRVEDVEFEDSGQATWDPLRFASNFLRARQFLLALLGSLPAEFRESFLAQHQPIPFDPAGFSFWLVKILRLHPYQKYELLLQTNAAERMETVVSWIDLIAAHTRGGRGFSIGAV